jgi:hypothetical protein
MIALTFLVLATTATEPATAQFTCALPTSSEWLKQGDSSGPVKQLGEKRVRPVSAHQAGAVAKLVRRSAVLLTEAEVRKFTGEPSSISDRALRGYLVRAVYPTANPALDVIWDGTRLDVFASGLGCAAYVKHPIVVFIKRPPRRVYVMASAAL